MSKIKSVLLATKNPGKIREFRFIAEGIIDFITLKDLNDNDNIQEDQKSYYGNAYKKALYYYNKYKIPTLAEDSGIEVVYLGNIPGVNSHRFAGEYATDKENNKKLLDMLKDVKNFKDRKAYYKACCVFIFYGKLKNSKEEKPKNNLIVSEGVCSGYINFKEVGENGFGYDPLFYYPAFEATFGQIPLQKKSLVSHRARALRKIISAFADIVIL